MEWFYRQDNFVTKKNQPRTLNWLYYKHQLFFFVFIIMIIMKLLLTEFR